MWIYLLISLFALAIGSFLGAFTYRWPKGMGIFRGRSFCDRCKNKISWFDNIPLLSFFFLKGKCRSCGKKISFRYPLIELSTAVVFTLLFYFYNNNNNNCISSSVFCLWEGLLGVWVLPYLLVVAAALIAIFIIDLENQLISDGLVFFLFGLTFSLILLFFPQGLYSRLLVSFLAASFLLLTHLVTRGRGMGLGDVKLALFGGLFLGWPTALIWFFLSFLIGAFVGLALILLGRASFGKKIPFGPFLTLSFFIALIWGSKLFELLFLNLR